MDYLKMTYEDRAANAKNAAAARLFELMAEKETNLTFSDDETDSDGLLELADLMGPEIAVLKTHIDIVEDFTPGLTQKLLGLAAKHRFMIFEDRKLADIGNTSALQYTGGMFKIADWANFVNVHMVPGPGTIESIGEAVKSRHDQLPRGILMIPQMSSQGNLATGEYTKTAMAFAKKYDDVVAGHIGNGGDVNEIANLAKLCTPGQVIFTPGVKIGGGTDGKGQAYSLPDRVVSAGSDSVIVGRGIYDADDPLGTAKMYREAGWSAYLKRTKGR